MLKFRPHFRPTLYIRDATFPAHQISNSIRFVFTTAPKRYCFCLPSAPNLFHSRMKGATIRFWDIAHLRYLYNRRALDSTRGAKLDFISLHLSGDYALYRHRVLLVYGIPRIGLRENAYREITVFAFTVFGLSFHVKVSSARLKICYYSMGQFRG